jgi:hypothetical protein
MLSVDYRCKLLPNSLNVATHAAFIRASELRVIAALEHGPRSQPGPEARHKGLAVFHLLPSLVVG